MPSLEEEIERLDERIDGLVEKRIRKIEDKILRFSIYAGIGIFILEAVAGGIIYYVLRKVLGG